MDQPETMEVIGVEPSEAKGVAATRVASSANVALNQARLREATPVIAPARSGFGALPAQAGPAPCPTCGGAAMQRAMMVTSYVHALGQIEARFPRPSVVKRRWRKRPAERTPQAEPTNRPSTRSCRNERTAISRGRCAGFLTVQGAGDLCILQPRRGSG